MRLIERLSQEMKSITYGVTSRFVPIKPSVQYDTPYVCQFAKPEHAELSLKKELAPKNDPYWSETGATSQERYAEWAFTMCGMASTAMALGYFHGENLKPAELAEDALNAGVYKEEGDGLSAMKYREFTLWCKKHHLIADIYTRLGIKGIQRALSDGKLVIVSVNPNIRGYETAPVNQKGGHLVLVTGYDLSNGTLTINNPSGFTSTNTQINHRLSRKEFERFYAGRGIVVSKI